MRFQFVALVVGLCSASPPGLPPGLPPIPDIPDIPFDPQDAVNTDAGCFPEIPLIGKICYGYKLETCDKRAVSFNITYNGQLLFDPVSINAEDADKKFCTDDMNIPAEIMNEIKKRAGNCNLCFGVKPGWDFQPSYANICPSATVQCSFEVFGKKVNTETTEFEVPCLQLGSDCQSKSKCGDCSRTRGCGWCGKHNVCMSRIGSSPYCETCPFNWNYNYRKCPDYRAPTTQPASARSGSDSSESSTGGGLGGGDIAAIVLGVLFVGVFAYVVRKKANERGGMLRHDPSLKTFSQPIQLEEDDDTVEISEGTHTYRQP